MAKNTTRVGFCFDESGSMRSLKKPALASLNKQIREFCASALREKLDAHVSLKTFGGPIEDVHTVFSDVAVSAVREVREDEYNPSNSTPLLDCVSDMIDELSAAGNADRVPAAYLVLVVTDGQEYLSKRVTKEQLTKKISEKQGTDRWTFVFVTPPEGVSFLNALGISSGNIHVWAATEAGVETSTAATTSSISSYATQRAAGVTSTKTFYSDASKVTKKDLKELKDVTGDVKVFEAKQEEKNIREFVERRLRKTSLKGSSFYQLMKTEKEVQDYKKLILRDKKTGTLYFGDKIRSFLGLPDTGSVKLVPGNHGAFDVFVQSTSTNRIVPRGTSVIYYAAIGVPFTEGPSAPAANVGKRAGFRNRAVL